MDCFRGDQTPRVSQRSRHRSGGLRLSLAPVAPAAANRSSGPVPAQEWRRRFAPRLDTSHSSGSFREDCRSASMRTSMIKRSTVIKSFAAEWPKVHVRRTFVFPNLDEPEPKPGSFETSHSGKLIKQIKILETRPVHDPRFPAVVFRAIPQRTSVLASRALEQKFQSGGIKAGTHPIGERSSRPLRPKQLGQRLAGNVVLQAVRDLGARNRFATVQSYRST